MTHREFSPASEVESGELSVPIVLTASQKMKNFVRRREEREKSAK